MKWPWQQHPEPPHVRDLSGEQARKAAERELAEIRKRKASTTELREWFRHEGTTNHFGQDVQAIIEGRGRL